MAHQSAETWPSLPIEGWRDTKDTLHLWTQIVGKARLALSPPVNHWWHIPLYLTARGLGTSPIPYGARLFEAEFDFVDHALTLRTNEGETRFIPLVPRSVADFYREYVARLRELGIEVPILARPVEVERAIPFEADTEHASYDPEAAHRCWRVLLQAARVLQEFRGRFLGKCSPVHFFWGSFDLAVTRFSGRPAPPHPGGAPNVADWVMREAYSHEVSSCGFWPGGAAGSEPVFYSYAYPEPEGFAARPVGPPSAFYHADLHEFVLPYEAVRAAPSPDELLLGFLQDSYAAAADLGRWERAALERPS